MFEKILLNFILKDIHRSFECLFQRGYRIRDAYLNHSYPDWCVELESKDCIIWIYWGRGQLFVYFTPVFASKSQKKIMLEVMVYYLSNGEIFVDNSSGNFSGGKKKQLERAANLLEEYIDQIEPYFSKKYNECKNELANISDKYFIKTLPKY